MTQVDVASASAEPVAARTAASTEPDTRRSPLYPWLLLAAFVAVALLAVWMISPRFEIDTPSLVDDWSTISESPRRLEALARLENPDEGRFVPSLVVWNYLQWHTFDAPTGLVGPNAWGILRVLILVGGLCLLTAVALPARRGGWSALLDASLVAIPAFAVFTVPKFARDVARFGPQEPLLVGGMALGGALLVLACRALLVPGPLRAPWRAAALLAAGVVFWLLGAYHKETSVCAIPLVAGFAFAGRARLGSWSALETPRKVVLGVIAAVVAVPLLHVAIATARISARGDLIYGAEVEAGGVLDGLRDLYDWAHEPLPDNARLLMVAAVVLTAVAAVWRRRIDWVAVGALVSGVATLAAAGQTGVLATRYYLPAYALFAVAYALSLARLPTPVQVAGALCVLFAFVPPPGTRAEVASWTDEELAGGAVVKEVRELERSGCRIAMAGVDLESSIALPVLVRLEPGAGGRSCGANATYFVVGPEVETSPLAPACAPGSLEPLLGGPLVSLARCAQLGTAPILDPDAGLVTPEAARRATPIRLGGRLARARGPRRPRCRVSGSRRRAGGA